MPITDLLIICFWVFLLGFVVRVGFEVASIVVEFLTNLFKDKP